MDQPAQKPIEEKSKPSKWGELLSTFGVILLAPIVALLLTQFVFQSYQVDGPSMETTLYDQERLIVTKTNRTWSRITGNEYLPKRYQIIIFNHSGEFGDGEVKEKQLVKRVIGLPGDRVLVKDNVVTVYNDEHPAGFLVDQEGPEKGVITITPAGSAIDETVKPGQVFVMGDNRVNSLDSRSFGTISTKDIVGKLALRIYPFDRIDRF